MCIVQYNTVSASLGDVPCSLSEELGGDLGHLRSLHGLPIKGATGSEERLEEHTLVHLLTSLLQLLNLLFHNLLNLVGTHCRHLTCISLQDLGLLVLLFLEVRSVRLCELLRSLLHTGQSLPDQGEQLQVGTDRVGRLCSIIEFRDDSAQNVQPSATMAESISEVAVFFSRPIPDGKEANVDSRT